MSFPNFKNKHQYKSLFSPKDWLNYFKRVKEFKPSEIPEEIIVIFSDTFLENILKNNEAMEVGQPFENLYSLSNSEMGVFGSEIGAAYSTTFLEELIAAGVRKFTILAMAGSLQRDLKVGDIVVCNKSIRDEGISYHYLAHSKFAYPSKDLTNSLIKLLKNKGIKFQEGPNWTIDAPYRETFEELKKYRKEGVLTVDMETSALFSVAKYRNVDTAALFVVSDILSEEGWKPQLYSEIVHQKLLELFDILKEK